jgi:hypothetical protein
LDPIAFRNPQAPEMVNFAQALFDKTDGVVPVGDRHFAELWPEAVRLNDRGVSA